MGRNKRRIAAVIAAIIFIVFLAAVFAPGVASAGYSVKTGKVVNCTTSVNVRSGPGTGYRVVGAAPKDALYSVLGMSGSWYKIDFSGKTAYIFKTYLSISVAPAIIAAYYGSWAGYTEYTPDKVQGNKLDYLVYAFAVTDSSYNITLGDPYIDPKNFESLKALKAKYPGLKTVISIGGWGGSKWFSDAAYTSTGRAAFSASAVAFIEKYGFDGVDIDWEYPTGGGNPDNISRPADKTNFTLLMAALRSALDTAGIVDGKHYILSFAGASETFYANSVELNKLAQYVDYGFLMAYDMHGTWNTYTDFNAPLYAPSGSSPQSKWSCDAAVKLWVKNGFPKSLVVMGVPFYGYEYYGVKSTNNGLYQKYSWGDAISYDVIAAKYLNNTSYKRYFSSSAKVPWVYGNSTFVSYDDVQSVTFKAKYTASNGLRGGGAWELSQDVNGTLLGALYQNIK